MAATCVRVPEPVGHFVSLLARFSRAIAPGSACPASGRPEWSSVTIRRTASTHRRSRAAGRDEVLVGRIRRAPGHDDALLLFACGDNLRKGAALQRGPDRGAAFSPRLTTPSGLVHSL